MHVYNMCYLLGYCSILEITLKHNVYVAMLYYSLGMCTVMLSVLYDILQALTMNSEARKTSTVGQIVNLMSVDCQRISDISGEYIRVNLMSVDCQRISDISGEFIRVNGG